MNWIQRLEALEPITKSQRLHDRIYKEIIEPAPKFTPETASEFKAGQELFAELMDIHHEFKNAPDNYSGEWGDMFGEYITRTNQTNYRAGQFLTPMNIVKMMTEMSLATKETLMGKPLRYSDPAAGAGRYMIATAEAYIREIGFYNFIFHNVDIDFRMYVYCVMNAIFYQIPSINIQGDSLAMKYWKGTMVIKPTESPVPIWINMTEEQLNNLAEQQLNAMLESRPKTGLEKFIDDLPSAKKRKKKKQISEKPQQRSLFDLES